MPYYEPSTDPEPGAVVTALVRYGDIPSLRRWERTDNGLWAQRGTLIGLFYPRTVPLPWSQIAECWAGTTHVLLAVDRRHGEWAVVFLDPLPTRDRGCEKVVGECDSSSMTSSCP
jgi:hypothetical protein